MAGSATVLVVEDDDRVRELVAATLQLEGYRVLAASNGMEAFQLIAEHQPALAVLDLMMPAISGLEVLEHVRTNAPETRVIILSALAQEENVVRGLQLGADDYLTKPFSPRELVARVEASLRRRSGARLAGSRIVHGELSIDLSARQVYLAEELVETTAREFDLLAFMAAAPGKVFTRHQLLREVWNSSSEWQQESTVTEHVRRLRVKIEQDQERPRILRTVRGVGYRFERRTETRLDAAGDHGSAPAEVSP